MSGIEMDLPLSVAEGGQLVPHEVVFGIIAIQSDMPAGAGLCGTKKSGGNLPCKTATIGIDVVGTFTYRDLRMNYRTIEAHAALLARNAAYVVAQHRIDADKLHGTVSGGNNKFAMARFHDVLIGVHACDLHQPKVSITAQLMIKTLHCARHHVNPICYYHCFIFCVRLLSPRSHPGLLGTAVGKTHPSSQSRLH